MPSKQIITNNKDAMELHELQKKQIKKMPKVPTQPYGKMPHSATEKSKKYRSKAAYHYQYYKFYEEIAENLEEDHFVSKTRHLKTLAKRLSFIDQERLKNSKRADELFKMSITGDILQLYNTCEKMTNRDFFEYVGVEYYFSEYLSSFDNKYYIYIIEQILADYPDYTAQQNKFKPIKDKAKVTAKYKQALVKLFELDDYYDDSIRTALQNVQSIVTDVLPTTREDHRKAHRQIWLKQLINAGMHERRAKAFLSDVEKFFN